MIVIEQTRLLRQQCHDFRRLHRDSKIGFVPTMGALHEGHETLCAKARNENDLVVVSIFVNPLQFGPNEDLQKYPRTLDDDLSKLERLNVDVVFVPSPAEIYPQGFQTSVSNRARGDDLCGERRKGHFEGVLTVVNKFFNIVAPDRAYFGKKDYQQLYLIKRMVHDLEFNIEIVGCATVRESDGLAKSSRNRYLSEEDRAIAPKIYSALTKMHEQFVKGSRSIDGLRQTGLACLQSMTRFEIEYLEIRNCKDLGRFETDHIVSGAVILIAVRLNNTRLIDNLELELT